MRKFLTTITVTIALAIGGTIAAPATAATCSHIWLTTPSYAAKFPAGLPRCADLTDRTADGRFVALTDRYGRFVDWQDDWAYTTAAPNNGRVKTTADSVRALADRYDMHVQFANRDLAGRMGCYGGFANGVSGAYQPSPRYPGEGLIRIGTGTTDRCMLDTRTVVNVFKYEAAHAVIERICGTVGPPIVGDRIAEVTSAYSLKYFNATMNDGGTAPTAGDYWRATKIRNGWCG